jgi:hypothetical protein
LVVLVSPQGAFAHRLIGAYRVLSGQRVHVQSFFPGGYPPRDATVKVTRPDKSVLAEGELDEKGVFVFSFEKAEDLTVMIRAAAGTIDEHTTAFTIPAKDLSAAGDAWTTAMSTNANAADEKTPLIIGGDAWLEQAKDVLIGVGFLLAVAAFVLSLRNGRRLRAIQRMLEHGGGQSAEAGRGGGSLTE